MCCIVLVRSGERNAICEVLTRNVAGTSGVAIFEPCTTNTGVLVIDNQLAIPDSFRYPDRVVDAAVAGPDDYDLDGAEVLYFSIMQGESTCFVLGSMRDTVGLWKANVIDMWIVLDVSVL